MDTICTDVSVFLAAALVLALELLRRRLQGLVRCSFQLEVWSEVKEGTTVTLRIPLGFKNANRSSETVAGLRRGLAS
jgi:hypothetical protein